MTSAQDKAMTSAPDKAMTSAPERTTAFAADKTAPVPLADEAQRVYQHYGDALYQVQVVDIATNKKNSIGSGFHFMPPDAGTPGNAETGDLIATNYHVIATAVQHPKENRLEYLHDKGLRGPLTILIADAVNDLAILRMGARNHASAGAFRAPAR